MPSWLYPASMRKRRIDMTAPLSVSRTKRLCTAHSAQALVPHQLTQDTGGAGFVGALGFEFPGEIVGQFDYTVALRLVGVVVGHVQSEVGDHLVTIRVLHQLHHGVEDGAQDRLM